MMLCLVGYTCSYFVSPSEGSHMEVMSRIGWPFLLFWWIPALSFSSDPVFFVDFCCITLYSMVFIPGVFCYFGLWYFPVYVLLLCSVIQGFKLSSSLSCVFPSTFTWGGSLIHVSHIWFLSLWVCPLTLMICVLFVLWIFPQVFRFLILPRWGVWYTTVCVVVSWLVGFCF